MSPDRAARPLARLGLLGDLHAEDAALSLALQVFADEGVEQVLSVGDNAGTLFRAHDPCFAVAHLAAREVTCFDLGPGGRVARGEPIPIPPPLGARR